MTVLKILYGIMYCVIEKFVRNGARRVVRDQSTDNRDQLHLSIISHPSVLGFRTLTKKRAFIGLLCCGFFSETEAIHLKFISKLQVCEFIGP